ncbi:hypothetical protein DPMN_139785 [Dreissena polymorpha]|uniref:Uncharacterized protein n=1 Tax=Dreissena polymorpha TaxID=45954 RepID=A0A9D4G6D5_DREPO|nr:hypothetical protein DPMN_139785 [Dreissena polymorpha]
MELWNSKAGELSLESGLCHIPGKSMLGKRSRICQTRRDALQQKLTGTFRHCPRMMLEFYLMVSYTQHAHFYCSLSGLWK